MKKNNYTKILGGLFTLALVFGFSVGYGQMKVESDGEIKMKNTTTAALSDLHIADDGNQAGFVVERIDKSSFVKAAAGGVGGAFFYAQDKLFFITPGNGILDNGSTASEQTSFTVAGLNGNVGIGTWSPAEKLDVRGNIVHSGTIMMSDKKLKKNAKKLEIGIDEVMQLRPIRYKYNGKGGTIDNDEHIGIYAQDLQKVAPTLVKSIVRVENDMSEGIDGEMNNISSQEYLGVKESEFQYLLLKAIQDQQAIIDSQSDRILSLEERLDKLSKGFELDATLNSGSEFGRLGQNTPNPFNNFTLISFEVPMTTKSAFIEVTDVSGQLIKKIEIDERGKGQLRLENDNLGSGTYFYRLIIDNSVIDSNKMIIQN